MGSFSTHTPSPEVSLAELARKYGTDKGKGHSYVVHYERHFRHLRDEPIVLLEIGTGGYARPRSGGESLRMWKEYFPRGTIIGLDIYDKSSVREDRIKIEQGSQDDPRVMSELAERYGPFDIVIDDGSHYCAHVIATFELLFDHVKPEGIYAIEDLQTSYWRPYGGSPRGLGRHTTMRFLTALANGLNHAEFDVPRYKTSRFDVSIESVTFYHNLAFIRKGDNREESNMLPPHPRKGHLFGLLTRYRHRLDQRISRNDSVGRALGYGLSVLRRLRAWARNR